MMDYHQKAEMPILWSGVLVDCPGGRDGIYFTSYLVAGKDAQLKWRKPMKKLVLATAVAALSITAAQAAPTVYGKVFLTVDADTTKVKGEKREDGRTQLNSNASRIGVKGSEALTENTDVVYQLEYRLDTDRVGARNFEARNTYLGLSNKQYGTVLAGRLQAVDALVDYANVTQGGVIGGDNVLSAIDAPRANNAVAYTSPTVHGLTASAMYVFDEINAKTDAKAKEDLETFEKIEGNDTFGRDAFGVAVQYEPEGAAYRAGVSYIEAGAKKAARVSGSVDATPAVTVGALYQNTKLVKGGKAENAFALSAKVKTNTPWTAYGQVDVVDNKEGNEDVNAQRYVVGGQYALSNAATAHVYGAFNHTKDKAKNTRTNQAGIGAGLEYKF